jgi:hypothetical protein
MVKTLIKTMKILNERKINMNFLKKQNENEIRRNGEANFLSDIIKQVQMNKTLAFLEFFIIIGLIVLLQGVSGQQKIITIINSDGETISLRSTNVSSQVLQRQVLFYGRQVIENYFDLDYRTAVESRNKLKDIMSSKLIADNFGKEKHIVENKIVAEAVTEKYENRYEWVILPWISGMNYPHVTLFGQIKRTIIREGYKPFYEIKNVKLVFQHLKDRPDPFGHPHDLLLISIDEIDNENAEFKNAINKRR